MIGSIRKRGEHSCELRVFAGRDPESGRKQYISRTVRGSRRAAEKELARLVAQVDDGLITARPGTVGELVERWYAKGELEWSPTTADGYRSLLDRRIIPHWGDGPGRTLLLRDPLTPSELGRPAPYCRVPNGSKRCRWESIRAPLNRRSGTPASVQGMGELRQSREARNDWLLSEGILVRSSCGGSDGSGRVPVGDAALRPCGLAVVGPQKWS